MLDLERYEELEADPLRQAEWEYNGLRFLATINPKRYRLEVESYLEGMYYHYRLFERATEEQIGFEIVRKNVSGEFVRFNLKAKK